MKNICLLVLSVFLAGCIVTAEQASTNIPEPRPQEQMLVKFLSLSQIHKGMTEKEVQTVLGDQLLTGYEFVPGDITQYKPLTLTNPYRVEDVQKGSKTYHVAYYFSGIKTQDGQITDDELIPLVFLNDKLVGQGWDFWGSLRK